MIVIESVLFRTGKGDSEFSQLVYHNPIRVPSMVRFLCPGGRVANRKREDIRNRPLTSHATTLPTLGFRMPADSSRNGTIRKTRNNEIPTWVLGPNMASNMLTSRLIKLVELKAEEATLRTRRRSITDPIVAAEKNLLKAAGSPCNVCRQLVSNSHGPDESRFHGSDWTGRAKYCHPIHRSEYSRRLYF